MTLIRKPEKPKRSPLLNLKLTQQEVPVVADVPRQRVLEGGAEVSSTNAMRLARAALTGGPLRFSEVHEESD